MLLMTRAELLGPRPVRLKAIQERGRLIAEITANLGDVGFSSKKLVRCSLADLF
jgi:hypothetical protein